MQIMGLLGQLWMQINIGEANTVALVFVNTNMAAADGLIVAPPALARLWFGKGDLTMALNGALAGLVAITAEPLAPSPIGAAGGLLVVLSIVTLDKLRIAERSSDSKYTKCPRRSYIPTQLHDQYRHGRAAVRLIFY